MDITSQSSLQVHAGNDQNPNDLDIDINTSINQEILSNDFSVRSCLSPTSDIIDLKKEPKKKNIVVSELRQTRFLKDGYHTNEAARINEAFRLRFSDTDDTESNLDTDCTERVNGDNKINEAQDHLGNLEELKLRYQEKTNSNLKEKPISEFRANLKSKSKAQDLVNRLQKHSQNNKSGFMTKILGMYGINSESRSKVSIPKEQNSRVSWGPNTKSNLTGNDSYRKQSISNNSAHSQPSSNSKSTKSVMSRVSTLSANEQRKSTVLGTVDTASDFLVRRSQKKQGFDLTDKIESLVSLKESMEMSLGCSKIISEMTEPCSTPSKLFDIALFHPISNFRLSWDILTSIILLLNIVFIPFNIAFLGKKDDWRMFEYFQMLSDAWFIVDIWINLNTGFMLDGVEGEVIMDIRESRRIYLRGWFTLDLVSTIPFDVIVVIFSYFITGTIDPANLGDDTGSSHTSHKRIWLRLIKSIKLFRMLKLLRLPRFLRLFMNVEDILHFSFDHMLTVMKIVNQMGMLGLIIHYMACVQFLGCYALQDNPSGKCNYPPMTNRYGCFDKKSWAHVQGLDRPEISLSDQYWAAFFRATSQMFCIGYGIIMPRTISDLVTCMSGYLIGGLAFAVFIGQATSWLENMDITQANYSRLMREVHEFLRFTKIPSGLCERIIEYYQNCYHGKLIDMDLLDTVNLKLKTDFYSHCVMDILTTVPILGEVEPQFLEALVNLVKFEFYQLGDPIVRQDEMTGQLFLLRKGTVKVNRKGLIIQTTLRDGEYFGEDCLISEGYLSESTIWADSDVSCFTLSYRDFQASLKDYPLSHIAIKTAVKELCNDRGMELRDTVFAMNESNKNEKINFDMHQMDMQAKLFEQRNTLSRIVDSLEKSDETILKESSLDLNAVERRNQEIEDDLKEIQRNYSVSKKTMQAIRKMSVFDSGTNRIPKDMLKKCQHIASDSVPDESDEVSSISSTDESSDVS